MRQDSTSNSTSNPPAGGESVTAAALLDIQADIIERAVNALAEAEQVVVTPILEGGGEARDGVAVCLASLHRAESGAADLGQGLLRSAPPPIPLHRPWSPQHHNTTP